MKVNCNQHECKHNIGSICNKCELRLEKEVSIYFEKDENIETVICKDFEKADFNELD